VGSYGDESKDDVGDGEGSDDGDDSINVDDSEMEMVV
jgi:hypothetical protein